TLRLDFRVFETASFALCNFLQWRSNMFVLIGVGKEILLLNLLTRLLRRVMMELKSMFQQTGNLKKNFYLRSMSEEKKRNLFLLPNNGYLLLKKVLKNINIDSQNDWNI